jgi:L-lactate dehydrogenase complex protein LldE
MSIRSCWPTTPSGASAPPRWPARTYELTAFLAEVAKVDPRCRRNTTGTVTYHDSCKGLRGLGIKDQPRELLARVRGLSSRK